MPELVEELIFVFRGQDGGLQRALRSRETDLKRLKTVAEQITAELAKSSRAGIALSQSISGAAASVGSGGDDGAGDIATNGRSDSGGRVGGSDFSLDLSGIDAQTEAFKELTQSISEAEQAGPGLEGSIENAATEAGQAAEELEDTKESAENLGRALEDLDQDIDVKVNVEATEIPLPEDLTVNVDVFANADQVNGAIEETVGRIAEIEGQSAKAREEFLDLSQAAGEAQGRVAQIAAEIAQIEKNSDKLEGLQLLEGRASSDVQRLSAQAELAEEKLAGLKTEAEAAGTQSASLAAKIQIAQSRLETLAIRAEQAEIKAANYRKEIAQIGRDSDGLEDLEEKQASASAEAENLAASAEKVRQKSEELNSQAAELAGSLDGLAAQAADAEAAQAAFADAFGAGQAALDAFFGSSISLARELSSVQTSLSLVSNDVPGITEAMRGLSEEMDFLVSTTELVGISSEIVANGFEAQADAAEVARAAVQGAIASESDLDQFTTTLTATLAAFGAGADEAEAYTDQLVKLKDVGVLDIDATFSGNFGKLAAGAAAAGIEVEDLAAAVAQASQTLDVNQGITGFNQALTAIAKGGASKQARDTVAELTQAAEELGLEFAGFDTQALEEVGLTKLVAQIEEVSNALGRDIGETLLDLTGSANARVSLLTLTGEGATGAAEALEEFNNASGAAQTNFEKTSSGYGAELQKIQNIINEFKTSVGGDLTAALTPILGFTADILENLLELPGPVRRTAVQFLFFASAAVTAAGTLRTFSTSLPLVLKGLGIYTQTLSKASPLAGNMAAGLGTIPPQAALAAAAIGVLTEVALRFRGGGQAVEQGIQNIRDAINELSEDAPKVGEALEEALNVEEVGPAAATPIDFVVNGLNDLGDFQRDNAISTIRAGLEVVGLDQLDAVEQGLDNLQERSDNFRITTFGEQLASDALIALEGLDGVLTEIGEGVRGALGLNLEGSIQQEISEVNAALNGLTELQNQEQFSEEKLGTEAFRQFTAQIEANRNELIRYQEQLENSTQASIVEESIAAQTLLQDALTRTAEIASEGGVESTEQAQIRVAAAESAAESILTIEERLASEREAFATGEGSTEERAASQQRIQALEDELQATTELQEQLRAAAAGELSDAEINALVQVNLDAEVNSEGAKDAIEDAIAGIASEAQTVELDIDLRQSQAELTNARQGGSDEQQAARDFATEEQFAQERIDLQRDTVRQLRELEESTGSDEARDDRIRAEQELNNQLIAQQEAQQAESQRIQDEAIDRAAQARQRAIDELAQQEAQAELESLDQGGTESEQAARDFEIAQDFAQRRIELQQTTIAELRQLEQTSGDESATEERLQAEADLAQQQIDLKRSEIEERNRLEGEAIQSVADAQQLALDEVKAAETERNLLIAERELQLRSQGESQAEIERIIAEESLEARRDSLQEQLRIQQDFISELEALPQSEDTEGQIRAAKEETNRIALGLVRTEIEAQDQLTQRVLANIDREQQRRQTLADAVIASITRQQSLFDSGVAVAESLQSLEEGRLRNEAALTDSATEKAKIERDIAELQLSTLASRQEAEQTSLELAQQRERVEAAIAIAQARAELAKARANGATDEELEALTQVLGIQVQAAEDLGALQANERAVLENNQQSQRESAETALEAAERRVDQAIIEDRESSKIEKRRARRREKERKEEQERRADRRDRERGRSGSRRGRSRGRQTNDNFDAAIDDADTDALAEAIAAARNDLLDLGQAVDGQTTRFRASDIKIGDGSGDAEAERQAALSQAQRELGQARDAGASQDVIDGLAEQVRKFGGDANGAGFRVKDSDNLAAIAEDVDEIRQVIAPDEQQQEQQDEQAIPPGEGQPSSDQPQGTTESEELSQIRQALADNQLQQETTADRGIAEAAALAERFSLAEDLLNTSNDVDDIPILRDLVSTLDQATSESLSATSAELEALRTFESELETELARVELAENDGSELSDIVDAIASQTTILEKAIKDIPRPKQFFRGTFGQAGTPVGEGFTVAEKGPEIATDPTTGQSRLFDRETYLSSDVPLIVRNTGDTRKILSQDTVNSWVAQQREATASGLTISQGSTQQAGQIAIAATRSPGGTGTSNANLSGELRALALGQQEVVRQLDSIRNASAGTQRNTTGAKNELTTIRREVQAPPPKRGGGVDLFTGAIR